MGQRLCLVALIGYQFIFFLPLFNELVAVFTVYADFRLS